jgi:hypothetical protein
MVKARAARQCERDGYGLHGRTSCVEQATEEELLNRIAAIQAPAEILSDNHELSLGDRHAFLTVIQTETARVQALVKRIASLFPDCLRLVAKI